MAKSKRGLSHCGYFVCKEDVGWWRKRPEREEEKRRGSAQEMQRTASQVVQKGS